MAETSSKSPDLPDSGAREDYERTLDRLCQFRRADRIIRSCMRVVIRTVFFLYFRFRIRGAENVPLEGPVMLVCNHISHLDPMMVGGSSPRYMTYMAKESLFRVPVLGPLYRALGAFPIRRGRSDRAALRLAVQILDRGLPLLIYPEGTRSRDGRFQEPQLGAAMIALMAKEVTIVPVRVEGSYDAFPPGVWFPRPRKISIAYGKPFKVRDLPGLPEEKKALYRALADEMMTRIVSASA